MRDLAHKQLAIAGHYPRWCNGSTTVSEIVRLSSNLGRGATRTELEDDPNWNTHNNLGKGVERGEELTEKIG